MTVENGRRRRHSPPPTPGPAGQKFLYGRVWGTLAWIVRHPSWGTFSLPLRALLYVRRKQIGLLTTLYGVTFPTKLEMAAALVEELADWLRCLGKPVWVVADGAYAALEDHRMSKVALG